MYSEPRLTDLSEPHVRRRDDPVRSLEDTQQRGKDKDLEGRTREGDDSLQTVCSGEWRHGLTDKESQEYETAKDHFRKERKDFEGCAARWEKSDSRNSMQGTQSYETKKLREHRKRSLGNSQDDPAPKAGAIWK